MTIVEVVAWTLWWTLASVAFFMPDSIKIDGVPVKSRFVRALIFLVGFPLIGAGLWGLGWVVYFIAACLIWVGQFLLSPITGFF
jgi:hypothetical protein